MNELIINLHMHTTYSDGSGTYADLGRAALNTGVDVLLVTDHNVWVQGVDTYYQAGKKRTLVIACEEIHDQDRDPQKKPFARFWRRPGAGNFADSPQTLISAVHRLGGLCFLAHPVDPAMPAFGETDISWWTGMSLALPASNVEWFQRTQDGRQRKTGCNYLCLFSRAHPAWSAPEDIKYLGRFVEQRPARSCRGRFGRSRPAQGNGPLHKTIFPYEYTSQQSTRTRSRLLH